MNPSENNNEKWLDEILTNALGSDGTQPDFEQWCKGHPEAIETLKSRVDRKSSVSQRPQNVWRIIMKSKITKFATAAVIIIGVLLGLYFMGGPDMAGVAWAEVVENVEQIRTYMYRGQGTTTGGSLGDDVQEMEMVMYWSLAHGIRMDTYMMDGKIAMNMYILPAEKMMIQLMPEQKKYMRILLTEELLKKMEEEQNNPRYMVKQFMAHEYTELGRDVIDGIEVEGIETTDPKVWGGMVEKAVGRLWVNVATNLPVRMEMEMAMEDMETKMVMDQFEWGIELDTSLFEPVIPADYELMAEVEMPDAGGEMAVEGLRLFAELTSGSYPSDMGLMTAMKELGGAMRESLGTEPNAMPSRENMEMMMKAQMVCMFYAQLVQEDKDPAYYGDEVTTEFGHAVLMRWKTGDDEYRVIFGDLTTKDVSTEELAELESLPLNMNPYAIKPAPADGAVAGGGKLQLSWMTGAYVTEHQVYFGTNPDELSLVGKVAEPVYEELGPLQKDTTYYWRVDEIQPDGSVVAGDVWSFNTGALEGWWKLDGDVIDSSGNGNDASIEGEPTYESGRLGQAIKLDGDDWVVIPSSELFNFTNDSDFTCSAWIRTGAEKGTIIAKALPDAEARGMKTFFIQNGAPAFDVGYVGPVNSTVTVNDGRWHLVAVTIECSTSRDNDTVTLYVDGNPAGSKDNWDINTFSEQDGFVLKIGNGTEATLEGNDQEGDFSMINWNGMIDDVRIYSYALSADELATIYESVIATTGE